MTKNTGHQYGVNLANYRLLMQNANKNQAGKYRSPADWHEETKAHVDLGGAEQRMSSTLRHTSNLLQVAAADQVVADLSSVESALKTKIGHTETLRDQLESAIAQVDTEIAAQVALKCGMEERLAKVQQKLDLNQGRLQVRDARPTRERTMDEVEKRLLHQQALISTFIEKVKRAIGHVDKEVCQLESVKARLAADHKDKAAAVEVDAAVLAVGPDGASGELEALAKRKHDCLVKTPHTWVRSTEDNLRDAQHWLTDAARLRKAIRHAIYNARQAEHEMSRTLNTSMMTKLGTTHGLKEGVEKQLARVRDEHAKAAAQRASLAAALEAKRGPLAQAKERFALRRARPCRESVQDDVEAALAREIAHLNAVTSQLSDKVRCVDREMESLDVAAATLEDNLRDKQAALSLDERCVLLDGRINIATPPPSSVATYPGGASTAPSTARSATLRRIAEMEAELGAARREREALESSIGQLKASLGGGLNLNSPTGVLSPNVFSPLRK